MIKKLSCFLLLSVALVFTWQCSRETQSNEEMLERLLTEKKDVTILVTDSGLGGLSVVADVASRLPQSGVFQNARIVFFSSLFKEKSGYNSLKNESDKVRIFNIALKAMKKKYKPDLLLIGCNTLSVVYHQTPFAQKPSFPVVGIVETGADLIGEQFDHQPEATVLIFATRTTIGTQAHKKLLVEQGYNPEQIIGQVCHRLAGAINRGYDSEETVEMIEGFVAEALAQLPNPEKEIFASLNCTDYGYSINQFRDAFAENGYSNITIIDPNSRMADFMFAEPYLHRFPQTQVSVEVVSLVKIGEDMIISIGSRLQPISPQTAEALENYVYDPTLFDPRLEGTEFTK